MRGTLRCTRRHNQVPSGRFSMERPLKTQVDALAAGSNARRRLIRGAFAAPAIMTVYSGSALANSSSLRCVANKANAAEMPGVTSGTDTWVRVQLWTQGSSNAAYYISGADVVALKPASTTAYIGATAWQAFDKGTNTAGAIGGTSSGKQKSSPAQWAAIRVDASGNIVGVGVGSGSAIAGTCWTSFRLAP
jgi:hypothetical protein